MDRAVMKSPNHALQRTRPSHHCCNPCLPPAGSLSLGRYPKEYMGHKPVRNNNEDCAHRNTSGRGFQRVRWAAAVLMPLSIIIGALGVVFGFMHAFGRVAESTSISPSDLAKDVSDSLMIGFIAILFCGGAFGVWLWTSLAIRRIRVIDSMTPLDSNTKTS